MTGSALRFLLREREQSIEQFCQALDDLLPQHMLACCAQHADGKVVEDENGNGVVTEQSCMCNGKIKDYRRLLGRHRNSRKGLPCVEIDDDKPNA
jgi:hypothetical protein